MKTMSFEKDVYKTLQKVQSARDLRITSSSLLSATITQRGRRKEPPMNSSAAIFPKQEGVPGYRGAGFLKSDTGLSSISALVHIIGPIKLQNELIARFLEDEAGLQCLCAQGFGEVLLGEDAQRNMQHFILRDCQADDLSDFWSEMDRHSHFSLSRCRIALFNVDPRQATEKDAIQRGIRGIFYKGDPLERLSKGVQVILQGELWFSRKTMSKLLSAQRRSLSSEEDPLVITAREREILAKIASGYSNKDIASSLFISTHTVKTHLYNIYRKINVSNRLQAILWATKNL